MTKKDEKNNSKVTVFNMFQPCIFFKNTCICCSFLTIAQSCKSGRAFKFGSGRVRAKL